MHFEDSWVMLCSKFPCRGFVNILSMTLRTLAFLRDYKMSVWEVHDATYEELVVLS